MHSNNEVQSINWNEYGYNSILDLCSFSQDNYESNILLAYL